MNILLLSDWPRWPLAQPSLMQGLMIFIGVGGLVLLLLSRKRRLGSRSQSKASALRRHAAKNSQVEDSIEDLTAVMEELDQLSKRVHARLDSKLARIEEAIHAADERLDRLARLERASYGQPTIDVTLNDEPLGVDREEPPVPARSSPHETVYRLADSGIANLQIAREIGRPVGEVELILSLRKAAKAMPV